MATAATTILSIPPEVFHNNLFMYLDDIDVYHLGIAGSTEGFERLKDISEDYVQLGKLAFYNITVCKTL